MKLSSKHTSTQILCNKDKFLISIMLDNEDTHDFYFVDNQNKTNKIELLLPFGCFEINNNKKVPFTFLFSEYLLFGNEISCKRDKENDLYVFLAVKKPPYKTISVQEFNTSFNF